MRLAVAARLGADRCMSARREPQRPMIIACARAVHASVVPLAWHDRWRCSSCSKVQHPRLGSCSCRWGVSGCVSADRCITYISLEVRTSCTRQTRTCSYFNKPLIPRKRGQKKQQDLPLTRAVQQWCGPAAQSRQTEGVLLLTLDANNWARACCMCPIRQQECRNEGQPSQCPATRVFSTEPRCNATPECTGIALH